MGEQRLHHRHAEHRDADGGRDHQERAEVEAAQELAAEAVHIVESVLLSKEREDRSA